MSLSVNKFLEKMVTSYPTDDVWQEFVQQYKKRLFHQLSETLLEFYFRKEKTTYDLVEIYNSFVHDISQKINPTSHAKLLVRSADWLSEKSTTKAISFMNDKMEKISNSIALVICKSARARYYAIGNDFITALDEIKLLRQQIENFHCVTDSHCYFYESALFIFKACKDYTNYYSDALLYFGIQTKEILMQEYSVYTEISLETAMSTLLSPTVTNIGAVLFNDVIMAPLRGEFQWLVDLLAVFNDGNIDGYNSLKPVWIKHELIASHVNEMDDKIILMNILNVAYNSCSVNRLLSFEEISISARISINEVEYYLIKALSLELIKGSIDEVAKHIELIWVKPRLLNISQISNLKVVIDGWKDNVTSLISSLESCSRSLYAETII